LEAGGSLEITLTIPYFSGEMSLGLLSEDSPEERKRMYFGGLLR